MLKETSLEREDDSEMYGETMRRIERKARKRERERERE